MRLILPATCLAALFLVACCTPATPLPPSVNTPEAPSGTPADTPSSPRQSRTEGEMCGGIAAFQCADGLFCKTEDGACRTTADLAGTCLPVPQACTREYRPVCGCDGQTYPNACEAAASSVSVASEGACETEESAGAVQPRPVTIPALP